MRYRDRSRREPNMPRIIKLELDEKNIKGRLIGVVILLAIAFTFIGIAVKGVFTSEPGWKVMECYAEGVNYSEEFVLNYYLGADGRNATSEQRAINTVYGQAMEDAYRIFTQELLEDGTHNIGYLNAHLNEEVTIEPALYRALELLEEAGLRYAYLSPVYAQYQSVFLSQNDDEAAQLDPMKDPELQADVAQMAAMASDPAMISLELLGDDRVILQVSDEYQAFMEAQEITEVLDLSWMTNAFVADFVADALAEAGLTSGYIASYDGFTRNLGGVNEHFAVNIFARNGQTVEMPGAMTYSGAMSMVSLRDYPMGGVDRWHYHAYEDGSITSIYLDPADGLSRAGVANLLVYDREMSCAQLLAVAAPAMIGENLDAASLADSHGEAIWTEDGKVFHTQADAPITLDPALGYTLEHVK